MPKVIRVEIVGGTQLLYFDQAVDRLDYDEAIVQGKRFPAQSVINRKADGTLEYSRTSTAVTAEFGNYPKEFFLNQEIALVRRGEEPKKKKKWFW